MKDFMRGTFRTFLPLILTAVLCTTIRPISADAQQSAGTPQDSPSASNPAPTHQLLHYSLPPDKLQKSYALYRLSWTLYMVSTVWSFLVLYLMLRTGFGTRLRDLAEYASRFRFLQAAIVMSSFVLVMALTQLPFESYEHHVSLEYGLSVQHWGSWFGDRGKDLLLGFVLASLLGLDSLRGAAPQPTTLVALLLAGHDSGRGLRPVHRAGVD